MGIQKGGWFNWIPSLSIILEETLENSPTDIIEYEALEKGH